MTKAPWFQANPSFFLTLKEEVGQVYPELHFSVRNNTVFLSGNFLLKDGNKIVDSFLIEIEFPRKYPTGLPLVFEIGGRIPRTIERHINSLGDACLFFPPQLAEVLPEGSSLLDFLNGPVKSFFVSQSYYELTKTWLFGEWSHREDAIYDYYAPILKTNNRAIITEFFRVISKKKIKGHWLCPCGSGKTLRHCHINDVSKLHHDFHYGMKQWGWKNRTIKPPTQ